MLLQRLGLLPASQARRMREELLDEPQRRRASVIIPRAEPDARTCGLSAIHPRFERSVDGCHRHGFRIAASTVHPTRPSAPSGVGTFLPGQHRQECLCQHKPASIHQARLLSPELCLCGTDTRPCFGSAQPPNFTLKGRCNSENVFSCYSWRQRSTHNPRSPRFQ